MKEIKAYVRPEQINDVIAALEDVGIISFIIQKNDLFGYDTSIIKNIGTSVC